MKILVSVLFASLATFFRSRLSLQFEIVALRHQLNVYQRTTKRSPQPHALVLEIVATITGEYR